MRQIAYINTLMSEIAEERPYGPLCITLDADTRMTKEEASEIIDLLQAVLDGTWKRKAEEKLEACLRTGLEVAQRTAPPGASEDVVADIASRVGLVLYLRGGGSLG